MPWECVKRSFYILGCPKQEYSYIGVPYIEGPLSRVIPIQENFVHGSAPVQGHTCIGIVLYGEDNFIHVYECIWVLLCRGTPIYGSSYMGIPVYRDPYTYTWLLLYIMVPLNVAVPTYRNTAIQKDPIQGVPYLGLPLLAHTYLYKDNPLLGYSCIVLLTQAYSYIVTPLYEYTYVGILLYRCTRSDIRGVLYRVIHLRIYIYTILLYAGTPVQA